MKRKFPPVLQIEKGCGRNEAVGEREPQASWELRLGTWR